MAAVRTKKSADDQPERFKRLARDLGADESEAAFEEKLKAIAKAKPASGKAQANRKSG